VVYARRLKNGRVLDLGVSGALYRDALVMYDRETGSFWSQVTGQAIRGPLVGEKLRELPSLVTTWREWKAAHPQTLLLEPQAGPRRSPYADYFSDPQKLGVLGARNSDSRLPGKAWVWGVESQTESVAVVEERLDEVPRTLRLGGAVMRVWRKGDRVFFDPPPREPPSRMYWFVWARFHPGTRIWPEAPGGD
jgi:hypothetical protein